MYKLRRHKKLYAHSQAARRSAFSLAELVISIAILLLMLSLAGQVFNLTVKSTGQATAITRVNEAFRILEETLREDLRHVQPGQSVMVIQGNPVDAYWTRNGKVADDDGEPDTGYPHTGDPERDDPTHKDALGHYVLTPPRADVLMFFTARSGSSYLNPSVTSNLQQIVYGHAEIGDYTSNAGAPVPNPTCDTAYTFNLPPDTTPPPPSLRSVPTKQIGNVRYPSPELITAIPAEQWHLARRAVLLEAGGAPLGTTPLQYGLDYLGTDPSGKPVSIDNSYILQGAADTLWNFNYTDEVLKLPLPPPPLQGLNDTPLFLPKLFTHGGLVRVPYARSQLSLAPPALCADQMGSYFMPNCASFKVEWSLNPKSEFIAGRLNGIGDTLWIDEGDVGDLPNTTDPPSPLRAFKNKVEALRVAAQSDPNKVGAYHTAYSVLCCPGPRNCDQWGFGGFRSDGLTYSLADQFDPNLAKTYCQTPPQEDFTPIWPDKNRPNLAVFTASRPATVPGSSPNNQLTGAYVPDDVFPGALRITVDLYDPERRLDKPIRHVMVIPIGE